METTFAQQHCIIGGHSMDEVRKELAQVESHFQKIFGPSRATPARPRTRATRTRTTRTRTATATARTRRAPQRLRGTARARTGNGHVSEQQMLSALEGKNGITGKQLATQLGVSHETALRKLRQWEKGGQVFRQGERSKTRWFARQPAMA